MSATQERSQRMKKLETDEFLSEASSMLNESYEDDDVTNKEHEELFVVFRERVDEVLPNPTSSEISDLKHILITRHSKNI